MLSALWDAGVRGRLWKVIDDMLRNDSCRIRLGSFVSEGFTLVDGTAQGRMISMYMFNGIIKVLQDVLERFTNGVGGWTTRWPRKALQLAAIKNQSPQTDCALQNVSNLAQQLSASDDVSTIAAKLSCEPSDSTRQAAIDALAPVNAVSSIVFGLYKAESFLETLPYAAVCVRPY